MLTDERTSARARACATAIVASFRAYVRKVARRASPLKRTFEVVAEMRTVGDATWPR